MIRTDALNGHVQHAGPSFSYLLRSWEASCHLYSKALCQPWVTSTAYRTVPKKKQLTISYNYHCTWKRGDSM